MWVKTHNLIFNKNNINAEISQWQTQRHSVKEILILQLHLIYTSHIFILSQNFQEEYEYLLNIQRF